MERCCSLGTKKSACWKQFPRKFLIDARRDSLQLQRHELDLVVLGSLRAMGSTGQPFDGGDPLPSRSNISYTLAGNRICKATFLFVQGMKHTRLENLVKHYADEGVQGKSTKIPNRSHIIVQAWTL